MKIAIIGTGNVGGTLATRWAEAAHQIYLGVQDLKDEQAQRLLDNPHTSLHLTAEAVAQAAVILVATPPQIAPQLVEDFGEIDGKIIIDATNAIQAKPAPYPTAFHAFEALTKAEVVKCFNTTGFENMRDPQYGDLAIDMFMAGDSKRAKEVATQLAQDIGFANCYDFGTSEQVVLLEQLALSWINLALVQGQGRGIAFKVLRR
ncbi:MAG: NADPH-dependent F420 reductase [Thermonemataceae bacterium]